MRFTSLLPALPLAATVALAVPVDDELERRQSCTITSTSQVSAAKSDCTTITIGTFEVPAGTTLDLTDLKSGTKLVFQGTLTFGFKEWEGPMISVSGTDLTITGASGHLINAGGPMWWDGEGSNGGVTKPKFFALHSLTSSSVTGLNVLNTPVQGFSIDNCNDLTVTDVTIDNSAGDAGALGHNTDAFDIGSTDGLTITGANVKNQDDCIAVNSGTNIKFTGGTCSGGHGLSIGSVGGRDDNTVENVTIEDSVIENSQNGVRIKTVSGATGSVSGVTYSGITLSGITDFGIVIEQDYENGSPTGTPTSGVPITDLVIDNVHGTVESSATNILILCAACSDWTWESVSVTGGKKSTKCEDIPSGASC